MEKSLINNLSQRVINSLNHTSTDNISGGNAGICLFLYKAGIYLEDERILREFDKLCTRLITTHMSNPMSNLTLYGGQTGVMWLYQYLINSGYLFPENTSLQSLLDYDKLMLTYCDALSQKRNCDLLYGITGIGIYFLERNRFENKSTELIHISNLIIKSSFYNNKGRFWLDLNTHQNRKSQVINLGFAHGIPSILLYMAHCHSYIKNDELETAILETFEFLVNNSMSSEYTGMGLISSFSHEIVDDEKSGYPSRIAWCYGDLTIGFSMLRVGILIENSRIADYGKEIILRICKLNLNSDYTGITDLCLCHGLSGVILVIRQISRYFDHIDLTFFEDRLVEKLYQMLAQDPSMHINMFDSRIGKFRKTTEFGFLEGLSGIGLCLLPKETYDWSNLVLC